MISRLTPTPGAFDTYFRTLHGEIRGGTDEQMANVAWALLNRWRSGFGQFAKDDTLDSACLRDRQFSCWNASDPNFPLLHSIGWHDRGYRRAVIIGLTVFETPPLEDPLKGATHYHARSMQSAPPWAFELGPDGKPDFTRKRVPVLDDGAHLFFVGIP